MGPAENPCLVLPLRNEPSIISLINENISVDSLRFLENSINDRLLDFLKKADFAIGMRNALEVRLSQSLSAQFHSLNSSEVDFECSDSIDEMSEGELFARLIAECDEEIKELHRSSSNGSEPTF